MRWLPPIIEIPGPLVGIGIDVCDTERFVGVQGRWGSRVQRVFSRHECETFVGAELGWCWAAREAIVKSLRTRMLGSPLVDMVVGRDPADGLVYRPRERARLQLRRAGVTRVELHAGRVAGNAVVMALAHGGSSKERGRSWRVAWGALTWRDGDEASDAARRAGGVVLGRLIPRATPVWSGGHGSAPSLEVRDCQGLLDRWDSFVSFTHDGGVSGALVAVRPR